jgi:hypothetical protein
VCFYALAGKGEAKNAGPNYVAGPDFCDQPRDEVGRRGPTMPTGSDKALIKCYKRRNATAKNKLHFCVSARLNFIV